MPAPGLVLSGPFRDRFVELGMLAGHQAGLFGWASATTSKWGDLRGPCLPV